MSREEILKSAIDTFGFDSQILVAIEEMSELTKALCKVKRAKNGAETMSAIESVKEEMVDVQIMLDQMRIIFGYSEDLERQKLERLEKRVVGKAGC